MKILRKSFSQDLEPLISNPGPDWIQSGQLDPIGARFED